jgi:hypothetical protein
MSAADLSQESQAVVRLIGQPANLHAIPADVLVRTIAGLQQLVYIVASDAEHRSFSQRFRVSSDIVRDYKLVCLVPSAGSYAMPVRLERPRQLKFVETKPILEKVHALMTCVSEGNLDAVHTVLTDNTFAKRALDEIRKLLPNADDSWKIGFSTNNGHQKAEVVLAKEAVKQIDDWLMVQFAPEAVITITGELIRIDFDAHKVDLRYPRTRKVIECIYSDDLEDVMIENRRDYIQVTGEFTVDADGNPTKLTRVSRIEPLDLEPIILSVVTFNKRRFFFKEPLWLEPELEKEDKQLIEVEYAALGLNAFARTREELIDEVCEQIAFLWDAYAQADDSKLTPEAQQLKEALLKSVSVERQDAS